MERRRKSAFPPRIIRISRGVRRLARRGAVNVGRSEHRIGVNGDGIFHAVGIAARIGDHHGDVASTGSTKDELIAALQSFDGKVQSAKLVFAEGIGASNIADELRVELPQPGTQSVVEPGKIFGIAAAVAQVYVNRRSLLDEGIVVLLVQRDSEHILVSALGDVRSWSAYQP